MRETSQNIGRRRPGGFSLIELLVAVLVMGIGVLGMTALQLVSLQNNRDALVRAEASQLAYDMMDRIRANPEGAPSGAAYAGLGIGDEPPAPPAGFCTTAACTPAQMVIFDQAMWKCQLGRYADHAVCADLFGAGLLPANAAGDAVQPGLPGGDGAIEVNGAGVVRVTVRWNDFEGSAQTVIIDSQG